MTALYDREIRYLDDGIRTLLNALDEYGIGENTIVLMVENHLRPDRVPSGGMGELSSGAFPGHPDTTFDFYPYAGIHRPVSLYTVPQDFIDDITVVTRREGRAARVEVRVRVAGKQTRGRVVLAGGGAQVEAEARFKDGEGRSSCSTRLPACGAPPTRSSTT